MMIDNINVLKIAEGAWFAVLGMVMGSFYNVLVERLPSDRDFIKERSRCDSCQTVLKWYDLVPVFSFIFLRGRCRYCGAKLSWQYPLSEIVTGLLFLLSFLIFGREQNMLLILFYIVFWSMLFVVAVMDFKYRIIIDQILLVFSVVGIVIELTGKAPMLPVLEGAAAGGLFYGVIYAVARIIYKKEGFGSGDVLLLAAVGVFLGPVKTVITGFLAFYCCLTGIIIYKAVTKKALKNAAIPFAPSVCAAAFIMSVFGEAIAAFLRRLLRI